MDTIEAVAQEMGYRVSLRPTAFNLLFLAVEQNLADVAISELTITEERKKSIDFTRSYQKSSLALLVHPDSSVKALEDLKGKVIDEWLARSAFQGRSIILGNPEAYAIAYHKNDAKSGQELNKALENIIKTVNWKKFRRNG